MSDSILSSGLTRRFGKITAVDSLDLKVRGQTITAFLGPNGAGKTTTISLLLGLIRPHAGTCEVLELPPGHPKALAQIGALVESPSLYDHLNGRENIEITRLMRGAPRSETDRVLSLVGLAGDARRPVRTYSLGMRQRLGIALALMGQPRLLILDEPTNGLDPVGIQEIRELIRKLPAETGATVFLSSHILAEIEQVAQDVVVIAHGRLRFQGPMDQLGETVAPQLVARVGNPQLAVHSLQAQGIPAHLEGPLLWIDAPFQEAPRITRLLVEGGQDVFEIGPRKRNLEERFLRLVEEA